jgi:hypothetical protein
VLFHVAADAVVVLHLVFIFFAVLGGWLAVYKPRFAWLHLPALAWGLWIEVSHGVCPLTPIENALRRRAGDAGYEGGFIDHYLVPAIYPPGLRPQDQLYLAVALLAINMAAYATVLLRYRRRGGSPVY